MTVLPGERGVSPTGKEKPTVRERAVTVYAALRDALPSGMVKGPLTTALGIDRAAFPLASFADTGGEKPQTTSRQSKAERQRVLEERKRAAAGEGFAEAQQELDKEREEEADRKTGTGKSATRGTGHSQRSGRSARRTYDRQY